MTFVFGGLVEYRKPFFERVRALLAEHDVAVDVMYEPPREHNLKRGNLTELGWGQLSRPRIIPVGKRELVWQRYTPAVRNADLVIVLQHAQFLLNYWLLLRQSLGRKRVAFWGHGRNLQAARASRLGEAVKRRVSRWAHWWFAYTELSAEIVRSLGYPSARITVVQNSIDTRSLSAAYGAWGPAQLARVKADLGIESDNVGVYSGHLDEEKRIPFLIEAASRVRKVVADFELIVIGGGQDTALAVEAAREHPWIHYVGPLFGPAKAPYFALAKVLMVPGPLGLVVLDSFALETPLVGSTSVDHGPEIDYLEPGVNGLLVDDGSDPAAYADAVVGYLRDPE